MYNSNRKSGKPAFKGKSDSRKSSSTGGAKPRFKKPFKRDDDTSEKKPFDRDKKSFNKDERSFKPREEKGGYKRPFKRDGDKPERKPFDRERKTFGKDERSFKPRDDKDGFKRPFKRDGDKPERKPFDRERKSFGKEERSFKPREDKREGESENRSSSYKKKRSFTRNKTIRKNSDLIGDKTRPEGFKKPFKKFDADGGDKGFVKKSRSFSDRSEKKDGESKPFGEKRSFRDSDEKKPFRKSKRSFEKKEDDFFKPSKPSGAKPSGKNSPLGDDHIRLNKYLSNAGICSRREADDLIRAGSVTVNGKVITEMGFKVAPTDVISYDGATLKRESKVYVLLNKPKDYITTTDDPRERHTVMELVADACKERLYPVGRLDRNTTGLLLFTNDGEIAAKLTHPKFGIKKVYNVVLNRNLRTEDFKKLIDGIELEDGPVKPDDISFIDGNKSEIGIEIHSGRNRIVRRMFEHLDYEVVKLDRTRFAGLTKKDLPRGKWRFLTPKEISYLKMIG